jgi:hypothetical protein
MKRNIEGVIVQMKCRSCGAEFPRFEFAGEDDTETVGLCSASACGEQGLVVIEATATEWAALQGGNKQELEARIARETQQAGYRVASLLGIEEQRQSGFEKSFQEFRKTYQRPELLFSCSCCNGASVGLRQVTVDQFVQEGGKLILLGELGHGAELEHPRP